MRLVAGAVEVAWRGVPERYKELTFPGARHFDFSTPEYSQPDRVLTRKWEATRGVGHSFGANHNEPPEDIISTAELIHLLVDVVSKNGNLLIGVGPAPDGTVPEWQAAPLEGLGRWLEGRGEAVYGTRPWTTPADTTSGGHDVRFTPGARMRSTPRSSAFTHRPPSLGRACAPETCVRWKWWGTTSPSVGTCRRDRCP